MYTNTHISFNQVKVSVRLKVFFQEQPGHEGSINIMTIITNRLIQLSHTINEQAQDPVKIPYKKHCKYINRNNF